MTAESLHGQAERSRGAATAVAATLQGKMGTKVRRLAAMAGAVVLLVVLLCAAVTWRQRLRRRPVRTRYDAVVWDAASRHHVSPFLVKAVIRRESDFDPWAAGEAGEVGLMQITTGAVKDWERVTGQRSPARGMLFDPRLNIEIGCWYLGRALRRWRDYRSAEMLALAQYNAGPGNASRWAPEDPATALPLEQIRFAGTREYISAVQHYRRRFEDEHRSREHRRQSERPADVVAGR